MSKKGAKSGLVFVLLGIVVALPNAKAQGLVGANSVAQQRSVIAVQSASPAARSAPAPRAPSTRSGRWMPVLGGLAAGGLLGVLFGGNVLFGILMAVLLVALGAFVVRLILRARAVPLPAAQFAGLGSETVAAPPPSQAQGLTEAAPSVTRGPVLPAGFDLAGFVRTAKLNFVRLQIAHELGELDEVREFSTPQLFAALSKAVAERGSAQLQRDVVSLNVELTELATDGDTHRASVRFSGMARATPGAAPAGFAEVWQLAKAGKGSTGWLLAGIRRLD